MVMMTIQQIISNSYSYDSQWFLVEDLCLPRYRNMLCSLTDADNRTILGDIIGFTSPFTPSRWEIAKKSSMWIGHYRIALMNISGVWFRLLEIIGSESKNSAINVVFGPIFDYNADGIRDDNITV